MTIEQAINTKPAPALAVGGSKKSAAYKSGHRKRHLR